MTRKITTYLEANKYHDEEYLPKRKKEIEKNLEKPVRFFLEKYRNYKVMSIANKKKYVEINKRTLEATIYTEDGELLKSVEILPNDTEVAISLKLGRGRDYVSYLRRNERVFIISDD